jgi:flavin reductase (DIM6/NTAB) family NADH-FMN oxidoreductase RutF
MIVRSLRRTVSRALLGEPIPQYVVVGLEEPQREVTVSLEGRGLGSRDVTQNNVVASLRPLVLAIGLPSAPDAETVARERWELVFREGSPGGATLGRLGLRSAGSLALEGGHYCLFEPSGHESRCLPRTRQSAHYAYQWWKDRSNRDAYNFRMEFLHFLRLWTFYLCPRPVALISVQHDGAENIFPMDLIGATETGTFSLALRNTSPSVELIARSRRVAMSDAPFELSQAVYALGRHHTLRTIDRASLPFALEASRELGLPIPAAALRVMELAVGEVHTVGSHMVFLARPISDERRREGRRMFHIAGPYQDRLKRLGRPL